MLRDFRKGTYVGDFAEEFRAVSMLIRDATGVDQSADLIIAPASEKSTAIPFKLAHEEQVGRPTFREERRMDNILKRCKRYFDFKEK